MAKFSPKKLHKHFWTEESGLTSMMVLLCISNFIVIPFFGKQQLITIVIRIIWLILLFTGITTLSKSKMQMRIYSVIPIFLIIVNCVQYFRDDQLFVNADFILYVATYLLLINMVFIKVFESGPVTIHRIVGAVVVYMLVGNLWAVSYQFLYFHLPGSLQLASAESDSVPTSATFLYFSYTTLTTTGYGDILPVRALARTLAIIEQLFGVLYPVILIGRLVSLKVDKS
jgi:Ion channel